MTDALLNRILRESGANLLEILAERLAPTDLQSLLLEVYRQRAAKRSPAALLAAYEHDRHVQPSAASPQALLELDRLAFGLAAPQFEPVELAPVCPLGTNSAVASVDQNKTIATIRNTEIVSDSTNVLALECAVRRRAYLRSPGRERERVRVCASHRLLRPQATRGPASFAHFRLFGACTAGRDEGSYRFELGALAEHVSLYLRLFEAARSSGFSVAGVRLAVTDLSGGTRSEAIRAGVLAPLGEQFPDLRFEFEPERSGGRNYYDGLCFAIYASDRAGTEYMLVDGGTATWTQQLLSNRKERLLISGLGTERMCSLFGP